MAISGGDGGITLTTNVDQSGLKKGLVSMKSSANSANAIFSKLAKTIAVAFSVKKIYDFGKAIVDKKLHTGFVNAMDYGDEEKDAQGTITNGYSYVYTTLQLF